jgi:transposase-like protein
MNSQAYEHQIHHRLTVLRHAEEISSTVAATCRYYGISRNTFYKWDRRFKTEGPNGLRERSQAPKNSPNATSSEVGGKNHLPAPELSPRSPENRDVLIALSRCEHQRLWNLAVTSRSSNSIACLPPSAISAMRCSFLVIKSRSM